MNKELLTKIRHKKKAYKKSRQGHDSGGIGRYRVRKAKAYLELNLARDVKNKSNEKGFCRCISCKRKTRENVSLLLNGAGNLVTGNMEESEILNTFFTSVFIGKTDLQESQAHGISRKVWRALKT